MGLAHPISTDRARPCRTSVESGRRPSAAGSVLMRDARRASRPSEPASLPSVHAVRVRPRISPLCVSSGTRSRSTMVLAPSDHGRSEPETRLTFTTWTVGRTRPAIWATGRGATGRGAGGRRRSAHRSGSSPVTHPNHRMGSATRTCCRRRSSRVTDSPRSPRRDIPHSVATAKGRSVDREAAATSASIRAESFS